MSCLIWIQTVWHFDGILERFFEKVIFKKKSPQTNKKKKNIQNYPAYKELNYQSQHSEKAWIFSEK